MADPTPEWIVDDGLDHLTEHTRVELFAKAQAEHEPNFGVTRGAPLLKAAYEAYKTKPDTLHGLREDYSRGLIEIEEFEERVAVAVANEPPKPTHPTRDSLSATGALVAAAILICAITCAIAATYIITTGGNP